MDIRENLAKYGYDKDNTPIIKCSALCALEGRSPEIGKEAMAKLLEAVDNYIPTPQRNLDAPFKMYIEDAFSISGRGTVVTGKVKQGTLKKGEEVEISGLGDKVIKSVVIGIEMFHKELDEAQAGDDIGVNLRGVKIATPKQPDGVKKGQLLSKPSKTKESKPYKKFLAAAYILTKEERGRHTSFKSGYQPQFYFNTTDVTGRINLIKVKQIEEGKTIENEAKPGEELIAGPGSSIEFEAELIN